jgi:hypothetical protein
MTALKEDVCDGFVVSGGATQILHEAHIIAEANKVFWFQLVGTGITASWALHFAAVCSHARWPAVNCHNLYQHTLLAQPLQVQDSLTPIPQGPGLGIELDWDAVERFRIDPIAKPYPYPNLLICISWPGGDTDYYAHGSQYRDDFMRGQRPIFAPGVRMDVIPNDGSKAWKERYAQALLKPSWVEQQN